MVNGKYQPKLDERGLVIKSVEETAGMQSPTKLSNLVNRINFERTEQNRNSLVGLKQTHHAQLTGAQDAFEQTLNENKNSLASARPERNLYENHVIKPHTQENEQRYINQNALLGGLIH